MDMCGPRPQNGIGVVMDKEYWLKLSVINGWTIPPSANYDTFGCDSCKKTLLGESSYQLGFKISFCVECARSLELIW